MSVSCKCMCFIHRQFLSVSNLGVIDSLSLDANISEVAQGDGVLLDAVKYGPRSVTHCAALSAPVHRKY